MGAIQGITEFLPVSSSGHLALAQLLFAEGPAGAALSERPLLLEIALHVATFLAVVVVYRWDVLDALFGAGRAVLALFRRDLRGVASGDHGANLAVCVALGTGPTAVIGLVMREPAARLSQSVLGLGLCFLACGCLLAATFWSAKGSRRLRWRDALLIGIVQGVAVLPGISRSGITIAMALFLGVDRHEAVRFSFMLALPAIIGAALLELDGSAFAQTQLIVPLGVGMLVAFVVGGASLLALIALVKRGRLWLFAPYLFALGSFCIWLS